MKADVVCLQETRAAAGRWSTGGWLSWRSGGIRGQYGCEVWLRPTQLDPPLTIQSCRILAADPRFIVVSCLGSRLLLTVCSAHAPHADRPAEEKAEFWRNLRAVLHRVPQGRSLCVGIDANADFCARDEGMSLIGELLGQHDMTSNDEYLFEFATALGLEAPATWTHLQRGAIGRWAPSSASQAWDPRHSEPSNVIMSPCGCIRVSEEPCLWGGLRCRGAALAMRWYLPAHAFGPRCGMT